MRIVYALCRWRPMQSALKRRVRGAIWWLFHLRTGIARETRAHRRTIDQVLRGSVRRDVHRISAQVRSCR